MPLSRLDVAQRDADRDAEQPVLPLCEHRAWGAGSRRGQVLRGTPVADRARRRRQRGAAACEFLAVARDEPGRAEAFDQELDPRLRPLGPVRVLVVQRDHRLHCRQQLGFGDEWIHDDRFARLVAEAAAGDQLESRLSILRRGDHTEVMQHPLRAVRLASGKADLEFARQLLVQRIAQEMDDRALQMFVDVGPFARAGAGHRAGRDIAHRV